jgi:hypothetical protein
MLWQSGTVTEHSEPTIDLEFNEEALRQNDEFKELWNRNISVAELSRRRRVQRFGIFDTEFLHA